MKSFSGLILAGGEGRRWGGPKAWAELPDGRSFLKSCFDVLRAAGANPIVATLPPGTDIPGPRGLAEVVLPSSGLDMFASLVAGLGHLVEDLDWSVVAILPVDHPLVNRTAVIALANATGRAAVPSYRGKHGHPICIDREVASAIVSGEFPGPTLREVLREVGAVDVEVDDPGVIANCNTPEALREALRRLSS